MPATNHVHVQGYGQVQAPAQGYGQVQGQGQSYGVSSSGFSSVPVTPTPVTPVPVPVVPKAPLELPDCIPPLGRIIENLTGTLSDLSIYISIYRYIYLIFVA